MNTNHLIKSFLGHTDRVTCLAFDSHKKHLFTGSQDTTIKVWNIDTCVCLQTLRSHMRTVNGLKILSNRLASISFDCTLKIWDITENVVGIKVDNGEPIQGTCLYTFNLGLRFEPFCLIQITSGEIVMGSYSKLIYIIDINDRNMYNKKVPNFNYQKKTLQHVKISLN